MPGDGGLNLPRANNLEQNTTRPCKAQGAFNIPFSRASCHNTADNSFLYLNTQPDKYYSNPVLFTSLNKKVTGGEYNWWLIFTLCISLLLAVGLCFAFTKEWLDEQVILITAIIALATLLTVIFYAYWRGLDLMN